MAKRFKEYVQTYPRGDGFLLGEILAAEEMVKNINGIHHKNGDLLTLLIDEDETTAPVIALTIPLLRFLT